MTSAKTKPVADPDIDCTPWERTRRGLRRDIVNICAAWPVAILDVECIGFGSGRSYDGAPHGKSENTSVETAAFALIQQGSRAAGWIAELGDVIIDLTRSTYHPSGRPWTPTNALLPLLDAVAELAEELPKYGRWPDGPAELAARVGSLARVGCYWWGVRPDDGETVDGVVVGVLRPNLSEVCASCSEPVVSGRDDSGNLLLKRDASGRAFHVHCFYDLQMVPLRAGSKTACTVDGCGRPVHARGWCQGHYDRWRKTGMIGGAVGVESLKLCPPA